MIWFLAQANVLAQVSPRTDMLFRGILIPAGLIIAYIGWNAIQRGEFHVSRHYPPVKGRGAILWGTFVILSGIACSVVSVISFL
ncbi:MAG TPA: hypothetical protein VNQ76_05850 [Planctomicrobium sp.]|nr:hypothetical protein [Planctomicrobium sp.]